MTYQTLFNQYYSLFRGDNSIPTHTDPEWTIGVLAANNAILRCENVDAEKWDWLWDIASANGFTHTYSGITTPTISTYTCPTNMKEPGGFIQLTDPVSGAFIHISVVKLNDVQFQNQAAPYAYFTGGEAKGYILHLNFSGTSNNGWTIDFPMYKTATQFNATLDANFNAAEDGSTVTEIPDPNFLIQSMLASRLFQTRNPFFQEAQRRAEVALKGMQQKNGTGTPGNPWNLNDNNKTGSFGPSNTPAITNSGFGI